MKVHHAAMCAVALSALGFQANAQQGSIGHLDGFYIPNADLDVSPGGKVDGDGFGVKGRFNIADQWFIAGEYQAVDYDRAGDLDQLRFGVGLTSPLRQNVNFTGLLEYINVDGDGGSADEDGLGIHGGLEAGLSPEFSIHGSVGYVMLDDLDGPEFLIGARFRATPQISVFTDYRMTRLSDRAVDVDLDDLRIGVGYHF